MSSPVPPRSPSRLLLVLARIGSVFLPLMGNEQTTLLLLGSIVGVLLALGALLFGAAVDFMGSVFFPGEHGPSFAPREEMLQALIERPWWWLVLAPAIGGLLVGPLVQRYAREARGHGIPEVMKAVALQGGRIRKRVATVKVIASALTIGSGGSAGREGPVVQIGSAIASGLSTMLGFKADRTKTLVACGAAAGIAATFNAPITGVVFSLEIITGSFGLASFTPVVAAAVMATVMTHFLRGEAIVFQMPAELSDLAVLATPLEVIPYAGLGLVAGLASVLYIRTLYFTEDRFDAMKLLPASLRPMLGGLMVGALGLLFPRILGQGYDTILAVLRSENIGFIDRYGVGLSSALATTLLAMFVLTFAKIIATSLTIGSGGSGGVFAPALFIGATLGGTYGELVHMAFPDSTSMPVAYALVGMGAVVAGVTHAPISAVLVLFEMTDHYDVILPLMLGSVISTAVCAHWCGDSIYTIKLRRKGIRLHEGQDQNILAGLKVSEVMQRPEVKIPESAPFRRVVQLMTESNALTYPVVDEGGNLTGILEFDDLRGALREESLADLVIAKELVQSIPVRLGPDHDLQFAFECFSETDLHDLPVMAPDNPSRLVGMLSRTTAMDAYNRALAQLRKG